MAHESVGQQVGHALMSGWTVVWSASGAVIVKAYLVHRGKRLKAVDEQTRWLIEELRQEIQELRGRLELMQSAQTENIQLRTDNRYLKQQLQDVTASKDATIARVTAERDEAITERDDHARHVKLLQAQLAQQGVIPI